MRPEPPLDLDAPRGVGELLATTLRLFGRHSGLFLSLALLVVAPYVILVYGVWNRGLASGGSLDVPRAGAALAASAGAFVVPVLVTALHVAAVRELSAGRVPSVGEALRSAGPRLPAAVGATLLYALAVAVGCFLLIVPGVWLLVGAYFGAQVAVTERAGPVGAVMRSVELVRGRWWRTAGTLLAGLVALFVVFAPLNLAVAAVDHGVAYVSLLTVVRALDLSLSALFGTLLYFSLRARRREREREREREPVAVA